MIVILLKVAFLDSLAIADQSWVWVAPAVGAMMVYTICRYLCPAWRWAGSSLAERQDTPS